MIIYLVICQVQHFPVQSLGHIKKFHSCFLLSRSGNEWLVWLLNEDSNAAGLKASVGEDPTIPPTRQWKFFNYDSKAYEEDLQLTCSSTPTLSSCRITVSLSGLAKDIQGDCEGEYKDTGLRSMGRQVTFNSIKSFAHFKQLIGVQTGGLP